MNSFVDLPEFLIEGDVFDGLSSTPNHVDVFIRNRIHDFYQDDPPSRPPPVRLFYIPLEPVCLVHNPAFVKDED